jgi:putative ABC transport system permease protein
MRPLFRFPWRTARRIRTDVDDELRFHLDMRVEELVALGLAPEAARAEALRQFGDIEDARRYIARVDSHTEAAQRRSEYMSDLRQDVLYAARKLRATPGFTLTVVITLALGIGATTAIFSVVNSVLLRPLPFEQPEQVVRMRFFDRGSGDAASPNDLFDLRARSHSFVGLSIIEGTTLNLVAGDAEPERLRGAAVSANFFDLLRVKALLGRGFMHGEDVAGAPATVVLSEALWRRRFNADPAIVGRSIQLNGAHRTVVGIVPAGMQYPVTAELWIPRVFTAAEQSDRYRGARWLEILGRMKPDVRLADATAEVQRIAIEVERQFPAVYKNRRITPVPVLDYTVGDVRKPLFVILGAVALVLLIACANVANLMLVRATTRESELAIRTALGAGRSRILRQLITESVMLAALGGAAGLLLARLGMKALLKLAPSDVPRLASAQIDGTALGLTVLVTLVTGVLFGVLPGFQIARTELATALRSGGRGARDRRAGNRMKRAIVVSEVALAVTLLSGAGLLVRSFQQLMAVDPGFNPENVLTFRVALFGAAYDSTPPVRNFARALEAKLAAIPGVRSAALSNGLPLDGNDMTISFQFRGDPERPSSERSSAQIFTVTPAFFSTLGMPTTLGRVFTSEDRDGAPRVVVVNRAFVKRFLPQREPLAQYVELGWSIDGVRQGGQIVGIVGDVKQAGLDEEAVPSVFLPYDQVPVEALSIAIRTALPPASVAAAARQQVRELDRTLPVYALRPLTELVASSVARQRFYATLLGIFAAVALCLAAVGLYGVISYAVSQRTHELGVRLALGATGERIVSMVMREGVMLTVAGLAIGLVGSIAVARVVASLLFGVRASDPVTFTIVAALLLGVTAVAAFLPARRAARVDPLRAMRS